MSKEVHYWMFRVSNKWGNRTDFCLENNLVYCGWNIGLSQGLEHDEIRKRGKEKFSNRSISMALNFTRMQQDDIILMPRYGGVAIGKVLEKEYRDDLEWQDTIKVEWLIKWYPKSDLSSALQSSLKYRGTFLNLRRYKDELKALVEKGFKNLNESYKEKQLKNEEALKKQIAEHINKNQNLFFQDIEFEYFIMDLFALNYPGLLTNKNFGKQEKIDGKDFTGTICYDDLGIDVVLNVQVKQHEDNADIGGLFQIDKSDADDPYTKNVLVTTGRRTNEMVEIAKEKDITIIDNGGLAEMIFENFDNIDEKYKAKLGLISSIGFVE